MPVTATVEPASADVPAVEIPADVHGAYVYEIARYASSDPIEVSLIPGLVASFAHTENL